MDEVVPPRDWGNNITFKSLVVFSLSRLDEAMDPGSWKLGRSLGRPVARKG